jgi:hypothetical protein
LRLVQRVLEAAVCGPVGDLSVLLGGVLLFGTGPGGARCAHLRIGLGSVSTRLTPN